MTKEKKEIYQSENYKLGMTHGYRIGAITAIGIIIGLYFLPLI